MCKRPRKRASCLGGHGCGGLAGALLAVLGCTYRRARLDRAAGEPVLNLFLIPGAGVGRDHSPWRKSVVIDEAPELDPIFDEPAGPQVFVTQQPNHVRGSRFEKIGSSIKSFF